MAAEELQRVFKTLSDPTRVRILGVLEREELAVQELMEVLGMAQSRVSRHLAILREAGLIRDRRDGTYVFYRFALPRDGAWGDSLGARRPQPARRPHRRARRRGAGARDGGARRALAQLLRRRGHRVGRPAQGLQRRRRCAPGPIARLVGPDLVVADVGTGTGILASELARLGLRVIGVDHSSRMLEAARTKLTQEGLDGVELRQGEASALPLEDAEVDAALAHMVIHYLPSPAEAIREMARS